jgi:hypothetical protein
MCLTMLSMYVCMWSIGSLRGPEIKSSSTRHAAVHTTHTERRTSLINYKAGNIPVIDGAYAPIHMDARL